MKLMLCTLCSQVFSLTTKQETTCEEKHCGGQYTDNLNAKVWGDPKTTYILGFANNTLVQALRDQRELGDLINGKGRPFTAFVIPDCAPSVKRHLQK